MPKKKFAVPADPGRKWQLLSEKEWKTDTFRAAITQVTNSRFCCLFILSAAIKQKYVLGTHLYTQISQIAATIKPNHRQPTAKNKRK